MRGSTNKSRFESHYVKNDNDCWNWTASLCAGYGRFSYKGKICRAHRVSYELYTGKIPDDAHILHKCDNKKCVNPGHLYAGCESDNARDRVKAGNGRLMGKLSVDDVICIRKMLRAGIKQWLIAWIYQVTQSNVSKINSYSSWNFYK